MLSVKHIDKDGNEHVTECERFTLDDDETGLARLATFITVDDHQVTNGLWCADLVQDEAEAEWRVIIADENGEVAQEALFRDYDFSADFPWMNKAP